MGAMTTGNRRFHEVGNNLVQHGAELQYIWGVRLRMQNQPYLNPAHLASHAFQLYAVIPIPVVIQTASEQHLIPFLFPCYHTSS